MFWCLLLLVKAGLFFAGFLRFDPLWNLLFLGLVLAPVPGPVRARRWARVLRQVVIGAAAALLLWHDSWLPPIYRTIEFLTDPKTVPSLEFVLEFVARYLDWRVLTTVAILLAVSLLLQRSRVAMAGVLAVTAFGVTAASATSLHQTDVPLAENLERFRLAESARRVQFQAPPARAPEFDIILLHVCSLSWDDMDAVGLRDHEFLRGFDILFTNFNSVTSYSSMATIRLLRSACGQQTHGALWNDTDGDCYLLDRLRQHGFRSYAAMDHDGKYGDFGKFAQELGHMDVPGSNEGIPVRQFNFDDTPIVDGYGVLDRWWQERTGDKAKRAVLYYNTITLHDGTRWARDDSSARQQRPVHYREAAERLFDNLQRLFDQIEKSGRNAMVIMVSEHGGALAGSDIQASGLREIPLPQITHVPAAVKFIGGKWNGAGEQIVVDQPVSYQALAWLMAEAVRRPPFGKRAGAVDLTGLPRTDFLAEISGVQVVRYGSDYYILREGTRWARLPERALPQPAAKLSASEVQIRHLAYGHDPRSGH
jgi:cellulose synthase operon protein YhjU